MTGFRELWDEALTYEGFLAASDQHRGLWEGIYRLMRVPEWAYRAVPAGTRRRLLVIAEDWCGDASSTVPILARFADVVPGMELRIVRRDEHPALMDRYLTNGSRSIPIVIVLDEQFRELGHWGPRPAPLQAWVLEHRPLVPKAELYPQVRRWYARDRGETTLREVLAAAGLGRTAA
ncbi:MAG TPA: thioredoxin family protein [Gemmatimonadales bacterium]|nr:thioredoxin family protein [Gemmatimonadales bacterium]